LLSSPARPGEGIGGATAYRLGQEGAKVVVNTRSREEKVIETVERIRAAGGEAVHVMGDIAEEAVWQRLVQTALEEYGRVDVLVQNAASPL
jgi:glucose 1-dehydrogenase